MRHLVIVGAGGFGRELYGAALESVGYGTEFDVKGFLDERAGALDGFGAVSQILVGKMSKLLYPAAELFADFRGYEH